MPPRLLEDLAELLREAGDATLEIFRRDDVEVQTKADDSPVTEADLASQRILVAGLRRLTPEVPIIAEESASAPWRERRGWHRAWLVDPLDGTREFVGGRGEFTINVALVDGSSGRPLLGAVRAPVLGKSWFGCVDFEGATGAWRHIDDAGDDAGDDADADADADDATDADDAAFEGISVSPPADPLRVVASRSHRSAEVDDFLEHFGPHELVSMGSSLKLCVLAEGGADLYPRLGRTMEWDIAAADAVLRGAGGRVLVPGTDARDPRPVRYNKEDLANPFFLATACDEIPWQGAWRAALAP